MCRHQPTLRTSKETVSDVLFTSKSHFDSFNDLSEVLKGGWGGGGGGGESRICPG